MDARITMPDLATTGAAIRVQRWLVKRGDHVKRGQPILEVETDKATMEVESTVAGTITDLISQEGDELDAGALMAMVRLPETAEETVAAQYAPPVPARRSMFERNARTARADAPALTPAARVTAQRLAESKRTVPHFYLNMSANAEPLLARRAALPGKPVWDAFFVRAVANSLPRFDRFVCRFEEETLVRQESGAVGVAADVDGDLHVLRIDRAREKTIEEISTEIRGEVNRIRKNEPGARRPKPGAISISNLGSTGVESFCAIINPPEAAILAIGAISPRACVVDGQLQIRARVSLTLSVDHRVASGKYAAAFLDSVVKEIESL